MKKYKVYSRLGSTVFNEEITARLNCYSAGYYHFFNDQTGEEWYFPIYKTIIETIK